MKPRLGILGCGWIGTRRLQSLCESGVASIRAIVEPDLAARSAALKLARGASPYESIEELFDLRLDGIVISTPSALHAGQSRCILNHKLAVFCQKPLGRNAAETAAVVEAARAADRLVASDYCYRFTSGMQRIRDAVHAGVLGNIYAIDLCFHNSFGPDKQWYYDAGRSGGGCVVDLGIHLIDLAMWVLGFPTVQSVTSRLVFRGELLNANRCDAVEDYAFASISVDPSVHITMTCSWNQPTGGDSLIRAVFRGTQGAAEFANIKGSFYDFRADCYFRGNCQTLSEPPDDWGGRAIVNWASQLASGKRFGHEAAELVRVAELVDQIYLDRNRS